MLTKTDLKNIDNLTQKRIIEALSEFFEKILAPYLDREHDEIMKKFNQNDEDHEEIKQQLGEYIKDHEKRISKLESVSIAS